MSTTNFDAFGSAEQDCFSETASSRKRDRSLTTSGDDKAKVFKSSNSTASGSGFSKFDGAGLSLESLAADQVNFAVYQDQEFVEVDIEGCVHEICYPPFWKPPAKEDIPDISSREPAKAYPFTLDSFQSSSVACLERNESVLVSAHTSAGKTVIAEYAIAMSLRDHQRVIYTSPIKALSNQKYRDLKAEFDDVGLMTGDVVINPGASCLVMTTEILRNMLYRGSEVMREVAWCIFDEVHYMADRNRGVVWEECMILLPDKVRYVFLSATIPNAREFCLWIAKLHIQPCNVIYTDKRPTPLQHYVFPAGGKGLHLLVDATGNFKQSNFEKALADMKIGAPTPSSNQGLKGGKSYINRMKGKETQATDLEKLCKMLFHKKFDPIIVFSFSRKECEHNAVELGGKIDFNEEDEKTMIREVFNNAVANLSDADQTLPQVSDILSILERGIGIHHSGLLPIIKEVTEILFQEGLLKILFSTETFSMGLNMPAKTVVFTSIEKFDGIEMRLVSPGEYVQMSGRAGRRGLDDKGIVIMMMGDRIESEVCRNMMRGTPDPLKSAFHVGYNMLLNLLTVEDANPEYVIERSLYQFQSTRAAPELRKQLDELVQERDAAKALIPDFDAMHGYFKLFEKLESRLTKLRAIRNDPKYLLPFLNAGRLIRIQEGDKDWGWGIVLSYSRKTAESPAKGTFYVSEVLVRCKVDVETSELVPYHGKGPHTMETLSLRFDCIMDLSALRLDISVLEKLQNQKKMRKQYKVLDGALDSAMKQFKHELPLLDPIEDMKVTDASFKSLQETIEGLEDEIKHHPVYLRKNRDEAFARFRMFSDLDVKVKEAETAADSAAHTMIFTDKLKGMKLALRRLGFLNEDNIVEIKGRVACQISTCDEIVGAELIFNGAFGDLSSEQVVALLSCLIFSDGPPKKLPRISEELFAPLNLLRSTSKHVAAVIKDCNLEIDVDEFVESFNPGLMEVVFAWCKGSSFEEITRMTNTYEGNIIRCVRRLDELLQELIHASSLIGNQDMADKFTDCQSKIKRDIVFAASLYL